MLANPELARAPLYLQVCELLSRRIADGTWKPRSALPNEGDLARELGVSPGTVRKALDKMEADRLVVRRQGRGTFVVDQASIANRFDGLRQKGGGRMAWQPELLKLDLGASTALEQQRLDIGPKDSVLRVRRLWKREARPLMLEDARVAASRLPGFEIDGTEDCSISEMAQRHGVHLAQAVERVDLLKATPEAARALLVQPAAILMRLDRVISAAAGHPIEWRVALFHIQDEHYLTEID